LHNVELVEPMTVEDNTMEKKWKLRVRDLQKSISTEEFFDAIMVCNGHYFQPSLPSMKGREEFEGQQIHSHDYRRPEPFADKRIVVIGAGPSGTSFRYTSSFQPPPPPPKPQ
jgi:dimethylaniline monooxygenase (N-oxide forming)